MTIPFFQRIGALALLLLCCTAGNLGAQGSLPTTPGEILLGLQKLQSTGSVLYIAAHPDDENTRLLAYLANERKVRTGYLSLTRGDGGQNLIGQEQGEALGLIRTQELLAARRIDGAEQFFSRAYDFGFSKNPEETFRFWNRDSVLADVVWVIRQFRPDVIITRFPTTGEGGHGHHTASAILAVEAFDAAADPRRFPEQLKWVKPWQARRIFWNTFNFGGTNTTAPNQLQVDVGGYNALLGKSYGEIAAESRSMHKSQGFGSAKQRGSAVEYFKLLKGDTARKDLFEGIDMTWRRIDSLGNLDGAVVQAAQSFSPIAPEASIQPLLQLYRKLKFLNKERYAHAGRQNRSIPDLITTRLNSLSELIAACSGLYLEASTMYPSGTPTTTTSVMLQAVNRRATPIRIMGYQTRLGTTAMATSQNTPATGKTSTPVALTYDKPFSDTLNILPRTSNPVSGKSPVDDPKNRYSTPYWLARPRTTAMFNVQEPSLTGQAETRAMNITFTLELKPDNGSGPAETLTLNRPVVYKSTDPVKGEIYRPTQLLPPVTANFPDKAFVFEGGKPRTISILVQAQGDSASGTLELRAPNGWTVTTARPQFSLKGRGSEQTITAVVTPAADASEGTLRAVLITGGQRYTNSIRRVEYDHIPAQFYLPNAEARLVPLDLKTAGKQIGYIAGAGDGIPAALRQVGYTVTELDEAAVAGTDLSKYNTIVTGVRAYNTTDWLQTHYDRLMSYVRDGGNLVVQYNTNNRIGPVKARIAPDSFTITRDRVTDEGAEVRFIAPAHPALNTPNKITPNDFRGWIQERGIYFASGWSPKYEPILSMNDPGEKPNEGSLIIEKYGRGNFVYTGLVFFRQLPAGNPGAYRLFVNLLSLPRN